MSHQQGLNRRGFLGTGLAATTLFGLGGSLWGVRPARGQAAANERLRVGFIGVGGMGGGHLNSMAKDGDKRFQVLAVCDVDSGRLGRAADVVTKAGMDAPKAFTHYEDVLAMPDIDAVVIATPDHWHCTIAAHAVRAGKDVYVEKPLAHDVEEGRILVNEARRTGRIVQVGQQQRSGRNFQRAVEIVRSGQLGEIKETRAWKAPRALNVNDQGAINNRAKLEDLDWDRWLGPAPLIPFDQNRAHYAWRYFWDQGGGLMTDWGVHMLDIIVWAMRAANPVSVEATGTRAEGSPMEVPYELDVHYQYPGFTMQWQQTTKRDIDPDGLMTDHGIAFIGSEAQLYVARGRMPVITPEGYEVKPIPEELLLPQRRDHYEDWLACVRDRKMLPLADVEQGHITSIVANMGNIAYRLGKKLEWDSAAERFTNDADAIRLCEHHPRAPYTMD